ASDDSCGRWSASANTSSATSAFDITHWIVPVPSRTWRKWSLPLERRAASQPRTVTVRPSCSPMRSTLATAIPLPISRWRLALHRRVARCLLIEELARVNCGFAAALLAHVGLGCIPIFRFGTEEQKRRYLVPAIKGEKLGSFGLSEPNSGSDAASIRTTAERHGDHYVINGTKMFITNGNIADYCLVAAYTDRTRRGTGISMFIVDTDTPGFSVSRKLRKTGHHTSETAALTFEDMRVPAAAVLGGVEGG